MGLYNIVCCGFLDKEIMVFTLKYLNREESVNSVDPDQTQHNEAADQCLHSSPTI